MKRGQLDISFGMIFSILIIIAIVAVAVYVIMHFLTLSNCSQIGFFYKDLGDEATKAWNSPSYRAYFESSVPSGINEVCFGNVTNHVSGEFDKEYDYFRIYSSKTMNVYFYPPQNACDSSLNSYSLQHVKMNGFFCVPVESGKVKIYMAKGSGDALVNLCASQSDCLTTSANGNLTYTRLVTNQGASSGANIGNASSLNGSAAGSVAVNYSCSDSDGGNNTYVYGVITETPTFEGAYKSEDYCTEDGVYEIEFFCNGNYSDQSLPYACPRGCANGACIPLFTKGQGKCNSDLQCAQGLICRRTPLSGGNNLNNQNYNTCQ